MSFNSNLFQATSLSASWAGLPTFSHSFLRCVSLGMGGCAHWWKCWQPLQWWISAAWYTMDFHRSTHSVALPWEEFAQNQSRVMIACIHSFSAAHGFVRAFLVNFFCADLAKCQTSKLCIMCGLSFFLCALTCTCLSVASFAITTRSSCRWFRQRFRSSSSIALEFLTSVTWTKEKSRTLDEAVSTML